MAGAARPSLLLIDDDAALLKDLSARVTELLPEADIRYWVPQGGGKPPQEQFESFVDEDTVLVVTDYDLTTSGLLGLFGPSVVGWSQQRAIPVGDYSRKNTDNLPKQPNLFEIRVPTESVADIAAFIASVFRGFKLLRDTVKAPAEGEGSAAVLAKLLGKPELESQFALYVSHLGSTNSALFDRFAATASEASRPEPQKVIQLLAYVLGHVLLNAVLKYPGPILSADSLCAYFATTAEEVDSLQGIFAEAAYHGPFADYGKFFWRDEIDKKLYELGGQLGDAKFEMFGNFNRAAVERALGRALRDHSCDRCKGKNGGYYCPFTRRPICDRGDCSVVATGWIPQGAQLSRVERDFYDEWAPLLGA